MKKFFRRTSLLLAAAFLGAATMQAQKSPQDMDRFIDALIKRMTVEEKIGQLNLPVTGEITTGQAKNSDVAKKIERGLVGGLFNLKGVAKIRDVQKLAVENSRLGIPLLFGMDVIHGYETIFPIPLGLSCTWDMAAIQESARIAAVEASADGISWTFSPMVDISRDPRWGRVSEGSGEDPFLGGAIAKAMVYGYQGANLDDQLKRNDEILACVKHFALYGAGEAGRDYNTVDMSRNRMFNEYMYPYEAAVEAGVGSVMASFNEIDGVPATANKWLMTDVLRKQWGFNGFVVTDFTGISEMIEHGIGDLQTVSARALNAGIDMDMVSEGFAGTLKKSVMSGKVSMKALDAACRRILEAKYKLGLFDNPYKYCDLDRPARDIFTKEHRAAARRIAAESFVLLKNGNVKRHPGSLPEPLLPLKKGGTVAVIGPLGNTRSNMPGTWSVAARLNDYPSLYEGLKEMMNGKVNITYAKGSNLIGDAAYEERATMFGRSLNRDSRLAAESRQRAEQLRLAEEHAEQLRLAEQRAAEAEQERLRAEQLRLAEERAEQLRRAEQRRNLAVPLFSIKTNLYALSGMTPGFSHTSFTPNLSAEFFFAGRWSAVASAAYADWSYGNGQSYWGISAYRLEPRFWLRSGGVYHLFYVGVYGQSGDFDNRSTSDSRLSSGTGNCTGTYLEGGVSAGCHFRLSGRWGIDLGLRGGFRSSDVNTYDVELPYHYFNRNFRKNRFGLTGVDISIGYRFGRSAKGGGK